MSTEIADLTAYFKAQGMYGIPKQGAIDYSQQLELDLSTVMPSLAAGLAGSVNAFAA